MRILQVNKLYAPAVGGIEKVTQDIAEGLKDRADMRVLVCQAKGNAAYEIYNGVSVTKAKSYGVLFSMPVSIDFLGKFRRMSREADVVQLHEPFPLGDIALLLFGCKGKVVVWWHSDIVRQKIFLKLLGPVIRHTLKRADSIIVAAQGNISSSNFLKPYSSKCKTIPYGLDLTKYPQPETGDFLSSRLNDLRNTKLLFVGRLVYYKGIDVLIRAMETVTGAELFIVGDGALERELKTAAAAKQLTDKTHFLGALKREQLLAAYADCDVFVFPSTANSEAFGLVQLEAMYYGKPVINTNLPTGVPYVSTDKETGLTVAPGNAGELAEAIMTLIRDKVLRETFGQNAAKRVREKYDLTDMLSKLYEHYLEVLNG